jgi:hypothetical protein
MLRSDQSLDPWIIPKQGFDGVDVRALVAIDEMVGAVAVRVLTATIGIGAEPYLVFAPARQRRSAPFAVRL